MDGQRLKDSFARVAMHGDAMPLFFFSDLFLRHPECRDLFPVSMAVMRDRFLRALATVVSQVDDLDSLREYLRELGRDHRKFGTLAEHYPAVGVSLLATLAHFSAENWTAELAADWKAAYDLVAETMISAAEEDAAARPPFWEATVVAHELRRFDIATFRVVTNEPLPYLPGQSVGIESAARPRIWRFYSMANAPREDQTLDFHVRMLDGGTLSMVLTRGLTVGTKLRLGPPVGRFTFDARSGRDVLLVAGGTGLAPVKAILEQISGLPEPPRVRLYFGARTEDGLYDLTGLEKMAAGFPWLAVVPAVSDEPGYQGERGPLPDVVARGGNWRDHEAYLAGPTATVEAVQGRLAAAGVPESQRTATSRTRSSTAGSSPRTLGGAGTRCSPRRGRTRSGSWRTRTSRPARQRRWRCPAARARPTPAAPTCRPSWPTCGPSATCTATTCAPTWKRCCATWRSGNGRSGPP